MKDLEQMLADHSFFKGMDHADLTYIAGCAHNEVIEAGSMIFREGQPANAFYIIRQGDVSLVMRDAPRGPLTIETLHEGDVLGWSWLFPPYRWRFDARANSTARLTVFDGKCLRGKCDESPKLGYQLMKRFAGSMADRFTQTRIQVMDIYGKADDGA